jgi:hypothetical protein
MDTDVDRLEFEIYAADNDNDARKIHLDRGDRTPA